MRVKYRCHAGLWGKYVSGVKPYAFHRESMAGLPDFMGLEGRWLALRELGRRLHRLVIMNARRMAFRYRFPPPAIWSRGGLAKQNLPSRLLIADGTYGQLSILGR